MDLPPLDNIREYIEIPPVFRSDMTGQMFERCLVCERYLLEDGVPYLIEKAYKYRQQFRTREIIFEYAMCLDCQEELRNSFSRESRIRIDQYFAEHVDLARRRRELLESAAMDVDQWLSQCVIKKTPLAEMDEYQMLCQCDGRYMLFAYLPYTLSGAAMDEIMQLLSNKTLDRLDGFIDEYFGLPPEFREDPVPRGRLLLI